MAIKDSIRNPVKGSRADRARGGAGSAYDPESIQREGPIKGRGAGSNRASRFLAAHSEAVADGWEQPGETPQATHPDTRLLPDRTQRLITRNQSPDIPFDQSINPYKGCEHGCVYCFARPTHAYLDLSPGLDFETRIFYKTRVRENLLAELARPGYVCKPIAMGTNTDPYQPAEAERRVTRTILEVLLEHRHPVSIVTKGRLILRDLDLLGELAGLGLASVAVSVTTLDSGLKARLEPRASGHATRLRMIRELTGAGIPTGVMVAPVIPFLNDHELEDILQAAAEAGAGSAGYVLLRLPLEVAELFRDWLADHYPDRAARVMNAVRASRGGKDYDARWGTRMRGSGVFADLIARRFEKAARQLGLGWADRGGLTRGLFRPPGHRQMALFPD